jgi:hypothetical protein
MARSNYATTQATFYATSWPFPPTQKRHRFHIGFVGFCDLDGTTIRIDRPTLDVADAPTHPSEGNLSDWRFDLRLTNNHDTPFRWASHGTTSIRALTSIRRADSLACGHEPYDLN